MNNYALQNLIDSIYRNYPNVSDPWEIVAIVEALGYTDKIIGVEFGCPNALVLGQFIYAQRELVPFVEPIDLVVKPPLTLLEEVNIFITQFSHSFVYTIPFIILLILNYLPIDSSIDLLPPELNSLFGFVTMASLITSSGFVQMIGRRGLFYMSLQEPIQANQFCTPILLMGITITVIFASIGTIFGFYLSLATDKYILIAAIYYTILSTIWMLFAIVGLQYKFAAPIVLIGITCCFFTLRVIVKLSALEAQVVTIAIAFIVLIIFSLSTRLKYQPIASKSDKILPLPNLSVLVYLLAPYFMYGIVYFGFIFADRLVATIATVGDYRIVIGSNLDYQDSMDLALLNLLIMVPLVEYFSYKLIIFWYDRAKNLPLVEVDSLAWRLQKKYWSSFGRICMWFGLMMSITLLLLIVLQRNLNDSVLTLVGCFGYLCFALGLFNTIVLLSLDRLKDVLNILATAMVINFVLGYLLGSLFGLYLAAIGLVVGAILFAIASTQKIIQAIDRADYCYFYSGY